MSSYTKPKNSGTGNLKKGFSYVLTVAREIPGVVILELVCYILAVGIVPVLFARIWGRIIDIVSGPVQIGLTGAMVLLCLLGGIKNSYMFFFEVLDNFFRIAVSRTMQRKIHDKARKLHAEDYEIPEIYNLSALAQKVYYFGPAVGFYMSLMMVVMCLVAYIYSGAILWQYNYVFMIIMLLFTIVDVCHVFVKKEQGLLEQKFIQEHRLLDDLRDNFLDIRRVKEIKARVSEGYLADQWNRQNREIIKGENKVLVRVIRLEGLLDFISNALMVSGILLSAYLCFQGNVSIGIFGTLIVLLNQVHANADNLASSLGELQKDTVQIASGEAFLQLPEDSEKGKTTQRDSGVITAHIESFCYPGSDVEVLRSVNLEVHQGEMIAIVGENGAGKSTLAKLLLGLLKPTKGEVLYGKDNLNSLSPDVRYQKQTAVFQDFCHYPLTVKENITLSLAEKKEKSTFDHLSFLEELPEKEDTLLDKAAGGTELSGGQWTQIALSRCWHKKGEVVILDEPSAALDAFAEEQLFHDFKEISKGKIALIVTHRLGIVKECNRILVIEDGELVGDGSHEELYQNCAYYKTLWDSQSELYKEN